jgi:hypothetical protein
MSSLNIRSLIWGVSAMIILVDFGFYVFVFIVRR